jgi:pimeloyl-ACP methyl ester carboxylesterase
MRIGINGTAIMRGVRRGDVIPRMRLIFLHGAGMTAAMWRPQIDALADEFDTRAEDLPGHRNRAGERFTFAAAVEEIKDVLADARPSMLVGLSLGGYVAIAVAAEQPSLVNGLVLSGCSIEFRTLRNRLLAGASATLLRVWPARHQHNLQSKAFRKSYPQWAQEMIEAGYHRRGYIEALRAATKWTWHDRLAAYPRPVLILNGEHDKISVREQDRFVAHIPRGRLQVIHGAGHLVNLDQPAAFNAAVRDFARSVAATP